MLKFSSGIAGGQEPLPEGLDKEEAKKLTSGGQACKAPRWKVQDVIARGVQDVKVPLR